MLADSLSRSRLKWTMEGIFEKYYSKPTKKKGVLIEEPNNPPKESMTKIGQVTITVEPHVFEATMFAVKDPKPPPAAPPPAERPIIQYGPPNGTMPPPPTPTPKPATPTGLPTPQSQTQPSAAAETTPSAAAQTHTPRQTPTLPAAQVASGQPTPDVPRTAPVAPPMAQRPVASPRGMESVLSPSTATPMVPQSLSIAPPQPPQPTPPPSYSLPAGQKPAYPPTPASTSVNGTPAAPAAAPAKPAPGTDPIIIMLAAKATSDPQLRDMMRRVAQGNARQPELDRFQAIIDAITAESRRSGGTAGPSADRLVVAGRTVQYFANEVRTILDIVLSSNPEQTSADLRPPAGSDALVIMLVKAALDDARTRDMVRRIAEQTPQFADATDLKLILVRLHTQLAQDRERLSPPHSPPLASPALTQPNGALNGHTPAATPTPSTAPQSTALRSKGPPPPPPKPDISAIVLEFTGGTGDRYLFPKFSLLESVPVASGQQVIASFLLVRKGSDAEYPLADPDLDYYQPLTIRLFTHTGRHLEQLARVVAPPEEVRRYMDGVMTGMTRAEYILLAMRLPRRDGTEQEDSEQARPVNGGASAAREADKENALLLETTVQKAAVPPPPGVLWTTKPARAEMRDVLLKGRGGGLAGRGLDRAEGEYQSFIASVSRKEV